MSSHISLLTFFLFVSFILFDDSSDLAKLLAALSGFASGYFLWRGKKIYSGIQFKIAATLFVAIYAIKSLNDLTGWEIPGMDLIASVSALIVSISSDLRS